jgi:hypothetical protein
LLRTIRVLGFCFLLVLTKHVPLPLFAFFVWCLAAGVEIVQEKDKARNSFLKSWLGLGNVCELLNCFSRII